MKRIKKIGLVTALFVGIPSFVLAEVPATVTTALSTSAIDVATVGAAVLVVIVAIFGFRLLRRSL
ncbi:MAG: major capsid protein [Methylococcales bacterium]|nr:major capsid protein [Methylococcales bacterium]